MDPSQLPDTLREFATRAYDGFEPLSAGQTLDGGYYIVGWVRPTEISVAGSDDHSSIPLSNGIRVHKAFRGLTAAGTMSDHNLRSFVLFEQRPNQKVGAYGYGLVRSLDQGRSGGPNPQNSVQRLGIVIQPFSFPSSMAAEYNLSLPIICDGNDIATIINSSPGLAALRSAMMDYINTIGADKTTGLLQILILHTS